MHRFMLFAGYNYYPSGGMHDFEGSYATMHACVSVLKQNDWWHVLDTQTGRVHESHDAPKDYRVLEWAQNLDAELATDA